MEGTQFGDQTNEDKILSWMQKLWRKIPEIGEAVVMTDEIVKLGGTKEENDRLKVQLKLLADKSEKGICLFIDENKMFYYLDYGLSHIEIVGLLEDMKFRMLKKIHEELSKYDGGSK